MVLCDFFSPFSCTFFLHHSYLSPHDFLASPLSPPRPTGFVRHFSAELFGACDFDATLSHVGDDWAQGFSGREEGRKEGRAVGRG